MVFSSICFGVYAINELFYYLGIPRCCVFRYANLIVFLVAIIFLLRCLNVSEKRELFSLIIRMAEKQINGLTSEETYISVPEKYRVAEIANE